MCALHLFGFGCFMRLPWQHNLPIVPPCIVTHCVWPSTASYQFVARIAPQITFGVHCRTRGSATLQYEDNALHIAWVSSPGPLILSSCRKGSKATKSRRPTKSRGVSKHQRSTKQIVNHRSYSQTCLSKVQFGSF